ncbi:MAG: UDP-N-acetylmuramoyl-L-alanyl-D-glutamate--2,6-diaminopimelate ligase [Proteobacteria bacterium]|nr:UDP-N-acetylmuramoyl-L-alanyl-D-glutamate--2,6-diaminopimelate ligase [Pseudomonadota bacterium]
MPRALARLIGTDATIPPGIGDLQVAAITSDSRQVKPGTLFAALPGTKVDGAAFIPQALEKGAVAVIANRGAYQGTGAVIESDNPRRLLALAAARFEGKQPDTIVAVTGTNGKTSVSVFVRQIWEYMGFRAASLGTIGVVGPEGATYLNHTTPDPVQLHALAAHLVDDKVDHLAIEASSHGLAQYRLDGLRLTAGGFTNITRDHLDYHPSFDNYFEAKMRLFTELLTPGSGAVINADSPSGDEVRIRAAAHGLETYTVGFKGASIKLVDVRREGLEQHLTLETAHQRHSITLPLVGDFQASNALVAAGLVIVSGGDEKTAIQALESLKGATGRLDLVGRSRSGASAFVDYAHTPDALENAILALRPFAKGKLSVVFGCGGDRDKGKRPQMGAIATKHADRVYVTDDNPRSEDPAQIRRDVLAGAPGALEIGDRALAIRAAADALQGGDILLVAGKGHEEGQIVGKDVRPFSDHAAVRAALNGEDYHG